MTSQLFWLLFRNTSLSWLINIEFVAPLLFFLIAHKNRQHHPILYRKIKLPVMLLMGAGLVKQIYMHFLFSLALIMENLKISEVGYWVYLVLYTFLLIVGLIIIVRLIYAHRLLDQENPWGDAEGNLYQKIDQRN